MPPTIRALLRCDVGDHCVNRPVRREAGCCHGRQRVRRDVGRACDIHALEQPVRNRDEPCLRHLRTIVGLGLVDGEATPSGRLDCDVGDVLCMARNAAALVEELTA